MARTPSPLPSAHRRIRGFEATSGLLKDQIRKVGEQRGFAVARLLTHWTEIAGEDMARVTRPVKVGYGREGMGASLTLLTTGPNAPIVEMQKEKLREKVNAIYGYAAISRILITQTAATGFAEGQAEFTTKPIEPPAPDPAILAEVARTAAPIQNDDLRQALERLGQNVLNRRKSKEG
ncbi:DUF721 domain-containing protein [Cypionkella sp.]|uniref:DUF721 domain-containing protein n=1 Tax=Cypionkella sp. TaxID=2811411 RepID=UPI00261FFEE1|nr:DciA family protein [Cypionkella sp.]MDB5664478.1 hypothetical protein [Cypionkella sp.]